MNKVLMVLTVLLLVGCAEKAEYEQAVLEQVTKEKDINDYNIPPEKMVECVVVTSSKEMPGLLPFDPERRQAYINYTKMLKLKESKDPKATIDELRSAFLLSYLFIVSSTLVTKPDMHSTILSA